MISARIKYFIIGLFLVASGYLLIATPLVSAQSVNPYTVPNTSPDVPRNQHVWTQTVMIDVMSAMICQIAGIDPTNPTGQCLGVNPQTGQIGYVQGGGGAIGIVGNMIAATYTPPIHTGDYFNYLASNFGIVKPVYAENPPQCNLGIGFCGLKPLMFIWSIFRNIAYLLLVIVFILIGLAIMLRVKIDPRTVMSIENQIPKIIIGLVLVTFSFAIAGFLIDMMYVFIYLIFNVFGTAAANNPQHLGTTLEKITEVQQKFNGDTAFGTFNNLYTFHDVVLKSSGSVGQIVTNIFSLTKVSNGNMFIISGILDVINSVQNLVAWALGFIVGMLAFLIVAIAILWALFRLWFQLIMAYIFILLDIVLAPLWILIGIFPGSQISFGGWLRDLGANLSAFPTVIAFFLAGRLFMDAFSASGGTLFTPPLIGNPNGGSGSPLGALIALGIILTTPQIVDMMKTAFKAPKIDLSSIGKAIGAGAGVPQKAAQTAGGIAVGAQMYELGPSGARPTGFGTSFLRSIFRR